TSKTGAAASARATVGVPCGFPSMCVAPSRTRPVELTLSFLSTLPIIPMQGNRAGARPSKRTSKGNGMIPDGLRGPEAGPGGARKERPNRWWLGHFGRVVVLMAGAAALLGWLAAHTDILFADGLRYVAQARSLERGSADE